MGLKRNTSPEYNYSFISERLQGFQIFLHRQEPLSFPCLSYCPPSLTKVWGIRTFLQTLACGSGLHKYICILPSCLHTVYVSRFVNSQGHFLFVSCSNVQSLCLRSLSCKTTNQSACNTHSAKLYIKEQCCHMSKCCGPGD